MYPFFCEFFTYYNMVFVHDIVTIKTINSVALEGRCMRNDVRNSVYIARSLYSIFTNPTRTVQIQLHCNSSVSHVLSSKTEAFIVPWSKPFCSLLTEVHTSPLSLRCGRHYFALALQTGGKFRRQSRTVCVQHPKISVVTELHAI